MKRLLLAPLFISISFLNMGFMQHKSEIKGIICGDEEFFKYIKDDNSILEKEPLEQVAKINQLMAFLHDGFWHCIDTKRDKDNLEEFIKNGKKIW